MTTAIDLTAARRMTELAEMFPVVDPGMVATGTTVLVQMRGVKTRTIGGIILPDEAKDEDQVNTVVGKVLSIGSAAYHSLQSGNPWPGGPWCEVGDFIRVPRYGGGRFKVKRDGRDVQFAIFRCDEILAKVTDPLAEF